MAAPWSLEQAVTLAVLLEVSVPKPGNVHRGADFDDATFYDFTVAAVAAAPPLARAADLTVGRAVLEAVERTRKTVDTNTNLGTILLIAPLAAVPQGVALSEGIKTVLSGLTSDDADQVYRAIRLANPGGLGTVDAHDVSDAAPDDLRAAMQTAADRDLIARQYTNDFAQVLGEVVPWLHAEMAAQPTFVDAVVRTHLRLMSTYPDSLIARKRGQDAALHAAALAAEVLELGPPSEEPAARALADLDFWLRADGHQRNPGTTADLVAAGLFAALRDGIIDLPFRFSPPAD